MGGFMDGKKSGNLASLVICTMTKVMKCYDVNL